jgi:DNA replication protein DnaC
MSSPALSYEKVRDHLSVLSLPSALAGLDSVLEEGQKQQHTTVEMIDHLLTLERTDRFDRRIKLNLKLSGIAVAKTLESFDFDAQPSISKATLDELATLRFLHQGDNLIFLGPPGVGKSHLAIGLALCALKQGHRVYFLTLHDLIAKARNARQKNRLGTLRNTLIRPNLLLLDEIGYMPLEGQDATFLFDVVSHRYEKGRSIILTSNKSYANWGDIFPDPILATALLDRLLHHSTTINIRGESYRLLHRRQAGLHAES